MNLNYLSFKYLFSVYHWAETRSRMYLLNLGKPTKISKLNEEMAIELGASLMGEVLVLSVAGGCLILEYNRQVAKEAKKEELRQMELQKFTDDIQALNDSAMKQEAEIVYLRLSLQDLAKKLKQKLPEKAPEIQTINSQEQKQNVINKAISHYENETNNNDKENKNQEKPS